MILVSPNTDEYELLQKQLVERLEAGNGEIIYDIGHGEGETIDIYSKQLPTIKI